MLDSLERAGEGGQNGRDALQHVAVLLSEIHLRAEPGFNTATPSFVARRLKLMFNLMTEGSCPPAAGKALGTEFMDKVLEPYVEVREVIRLDLQGHSAYERIKCQMELCRGRCTA